MTKRPRPLWLVLGTCIPAAAAVFAHVGALAGQFVWLDHGDLESGAALGPWLSLFTKGFSRTGFYRPLVALSLSLDSLGGGPLVFHATNLAWHAMAATACMVAARTFRLTHWHAVLAATAFAVHPLAGVVSNLISNRQEAMVATALFVLAWAVRTQRPVSAFLAALLAALCKETGLVLAVPVALCAALDAQPRDQPMQQGTLAMLVRDLRLARNTVLSTAAAVGGALVLRQTFAPALRSVQPHLTLAEHLATRFAAFGHAAGALFSVHPSVCDTLPIEPPLTLISLSGAGLLLLVGLAVVRHRGLGLLLAFTLLPLAQLVPGPRFWSPHYVYLPLGWLATLVAHSLQGRGRAGWLGAGVCAVLAGFALKDAPRFATDSSLFGEEQCREARSYYGDWLRREGRLDEAATTLELAVANPTHALEFCDEAFAWQSLGLTRLAQKNYFEAELAFDQALERQRDAYARRRLTHNLAVVALMRGDPATTERLLQDEVKRGDALAESLDVLSRALMLMGRPEEAHALIERTRK